MFLHHTSEVVHESLLVGPLFSLGKLLDLIYSLVVGLSSVAIYILPVLSSLLGSLALGL